MAELVGLESFRIIFGTTFNKSGIDKIHGCVCGQLQEHQLEYFSFAQWQGSLPVHGLPRPLHWANTFLGRGMCLSFDLVFLHNKAFNSKTDRLVDNRGGSCVGVIICFLVIGGLIRARGCVAGEGLSFV